MLATSSEMLSFYFLLRSSRPYGFTRRGSSTRGKKYETTTREARQVVDVNIIQSMQRPTSQLTSNLISREPKSERREIKSECLFGVVKYINYKHTRISGFFWCPRPKLIIPCCNVGTKRSRWARETVHKMKRRCGAVEWVDWDLFCCPFPFTYQRFADNTKRNAWEQSC